MRLAGPLVRQYVHTLGFGPQRLRLQAQEAAGCESVFAELLALGAEQTSRSRFRVLSLLQSLPPLCGYKASIAPNETALADRVLSHVRTQMDRGENVEELSQLFGVSRYTMFNHFRDRYGESPIRMLKQERLERARHLLGSTALRVGEIGRLCGYQQVFLCTDPYSITF